VTRQEHHTGRALSVTDDVVVRDLHYAYPQSRGDGEFVPVLGGVNLHIAGGEFVVLLGRVGAGKTTLCMALNGLVPHATGGRYRGDVTVLGLNTKEHSVADLARQVGLVFQDPETQLTQMRVEDEIAFGPENLGVPPAEIEERVTWALDAVGLSACRDRSPLRLSGGQKQRVAIAAMLAMQPRLLVLDEPTASLDPIGKVGVFNVLADLARERRLAVVMATQELEWVPRFADRVLVLHEGRIALEGAPADVFHHAGELQEWGIGVPQMVELADLLSQRTGHCYGFSTVAGAYRQLTRHAEQEKIPGAIPIAQQGRAVAPPYRNSTGTPHRDSTGTAHRDSTPTPLPAGQRSAEVIPSRDDPPERPDLSLTPPPTIRVEDVSYTYADGTAALQGVSLDLEPGEFVALLGPNGSGKTTLAKHLDGLLRSSSGRVLVGDLDTRRASVAQLARQVGYVFQNPDHQIFAATVEEEVAFGPRSQGLPEDAVARRAAEALDLFGLASCADVPPASLGFAQRRQVALAAVLAAGPRVLILDEPTGGLDARSRSEIMSVIAGFNAGTLARSAEPGRAASPKARPRGQAAPTLGAAGGTVLLITHDMVLVAEYARRAVVLVDGRVLFDGAVPDLFRQRDLLARAGLGLPPVVRLANRLARHGLAAGVLTPHDLVEAWAGPPQTPVDAAHLDGADISQRSNVQTFERSTPPRPGGPPAKGDRDAAGI
jgi:energy-coupling factor transporter ATP-binding protein EcfA2